MKTWNYFTHPIHYFTVVLSFLAFVAFTTPAVLAVPITFTYSSTTDATSIGESSTAAVILNYTFDSELLNGTGSLSPTNSTSLGSYAPWSGTLDIGAQSITLDGGSISIFNAGDDSYEIRWRRANPSNVSSHSLFTKTLDFFRILLVDTDANMFSGTALPTTTSFSSATDFIDDTYRFSDGTRAGKNEETSTQNKRGFILSTSTDPIPEPATIALLGIGLAGLAGVEVRRRRKKKAVGNS